METTGYNYPGWGSEITTGGSPSPSGNEGLWATIESISTKILNAAGNRAQAKIQGQPVVGTGGYGEQSDKDTYIAIGVGVLILVVVVMAFR